MFKTVAIIVLSAAALLALVAAGVSWHDLPIDRREQILGNVGRFIGWSLLVGVIPWAGMFLVGRVAKQDSNAASATLVAGLTAVEALALAWLFHFSIGGATPWTFFLAAVLIAGVYNLLTCDWIAERFGE